MASRVLITGSREWVDEDKMVRALSLLPEHIVELVHGGARGADLMAEKLWTSWRGYRALQIVAEWDTLGKAAGVIRNQHMVDLGDYAVCLAFPLGESRGTRDCMARARKAGILVLEVT